jgi:PKD repeat protein
VILTVTPQSGLAPLTLTADASRSTDTDATRIAAYDFDFGDGTPHAWGATAPHQYCMAGIYRLTVVVTDTAGLRSSAYVYVEVTQPVNQTIC